MKHTKGEWKISQALSDRHQKTIISKSHIIAEVKRYGDIDKEQEIEANAKLIAAAPELLEVCIKAMESEIDGSYVAASEWWGVMKEAIKKATE